MGFLFFCCLFVENVRLNSTGSHGFRIFVFYLFLPFLYPFRAFIPFPLLHITTVKWVKVKSLTFRMSSFEYRSAICVCVWKLHILQCNVSDGGVLTRSCGILKLNVSDGGVLVFIFCCGILKSNVSDGGVLICSCGILRCNVTDGGALLCSCGILKLNVSGGGVLILYVAVEFWNLTYQMVVYLYISVEFWIYRTAGYLFYI